MSVISEFNLIQLNTYIRHFSPELDTSPSQNTIHSVASPPTGTFLGGGRKLVTPEYIQADTGRTGADTPLRW